MTVMDLRERTSGAADTGSGIRHFVIGDPGPERLVVPKATVVSADPEAWMHAEVATPTDASAADIPAPEERPDVPDDEQVGEGMRKPDLEPEP